MTFMNNWSNAWGKLNTYINIFANKNAVI